MVGRDCDAKSPMYLLLWAFLTSSDAKFSSIGYIEDLEVEGATGIAVRVKRCKPNTLTIAEDLGERFDRKVQPAFGGQI